MSRTTQKNCISCGKKKIRNLINLKNFPITGIFCKKVNNQKKNLELLYCNNCSHIFHTTQIKRNTYNPKIYLNKPSKNFLANQALKFFSKFVLKNLEQEKNNNFLEIGAGDTSFYNLIKQNSKFYYIIDPAMKNYYSNRQKLRIYQTKLENFNLKKITSKINIDAVLLSHVIEHTQNPKLFLKNIVDNISKNTKIFIEIPCTELMIKNLRFDQIFFNHISYFTSESIRQLFKNLGLTILDSKINLQHWGGTVLFALTINKEEKKVSNFYTVKNTHKIFLRNFQIYKNKMKIIKKIISKKRGIIGYGAGQNTPTLGYFLNTDLSFLKYIADDDTRKHQKYCINTSPKIKKFNRADLNNNSYLITAVDNSKILTQKLIKLKFKSREIINIKKILNPDNNL